MLEVNGLGLELNEIIYQISGKFWKQTYNNLILQLANVEKDFEITPNKAIVRFRKEVCILAKNNQLACKLSAVNGKNYISIIPLPIYIGIEKVTGEISIGAPHINTKHFHFYEYKLALAWVQNYINIDLAPLSTQIDNVRDIYYINSKTSEIIKSSIKAITSSNLENKGWLYELIQYELKSQLYVEIDASTKYCIEVFHKAFSQDVSLFLNQLNNPHEEFVDGKIYSYIIEKD